MPKSLQLCCNFLSLPIQTPHTSQYLILGIQDTVSQDTLTEIADEDISTSKMETVSMKDENVTDTHTTQHDDNAQCDTSVVHMSRPRNRCSPQSRPSRNVSSSGSQRRGSHSKGARTPLRKATAEQTRTP